MNVGYKFAEKLQRDMGERTDILYSSLSNYFFKNKIFNRKTLEELKNRYKCKWIIGTGHHRGGLIRLNKIKKNIKINTAIVSRENFKFVRSKVITSKKMTSGIITIFDLLGYNISELYVTGMTFYDLKIMKNRKKFYYKNYVERYISKSPIMYHNPGKELKFFRQLYKKDRRKTTSKER